MTVDVKQIGKRVEAESAFVEKIFAQIRQRIVGQDHLVRALVNGILSNGHILLEGVPGLAKTLSVKTLADAIRADFRRIQFTPDLLPADLIGTLIYNPASGQFTTRRGPIFANIVLADEINRAPAKVQSALLEAMQERQVTIGDQTFPLPNLFLVLATQNPIEQEGTYPLPEAQVDRFLFKVKVDYPSKEDERKILDMASGAARAPAYVEPVITPEEILRVRATVDEIYMDDKIKDYIVEIIQATRRPKEFGLDLENIIDYGASPRATISLATASRTNAFLERRPYVTPQDVKSVAPDILRHRVILTYEAEAEEVTPEDVVQRVLDGVRVP
ncbi:MAG TPA: MoxR family ATPase [Planctomycetota bacterium]|nr:MoxR family ATPase [Planctomycetota bacterium]